MAVKIVRQPKSIALLGAPTSAASMAAGHERAPAALRASGLVQRLSDAGFSVTDYGDCTIRAFETDDEHPRARNAGKVLATLEELRPKVEIAVKSGALPLVIGGDDSNVLAVSAGVRRYFRNAGLVYFDRDAGLNVPATTPSGCVDGMVISHVIGRGAPELVRFWGEPPLVREPDVTLFGVGRLDEPEREFLMRSPLRRYLAEDVARMGGAAAAEETLDHVHARRYEFVLHLDLDVIAAEDFRATNLSDSGGLRLDDVRRALAVFLRQPTLAAISIAAYNPALDPDGTAAKLVIEILTEALAPRLAPPESAPEPAVAVEPAAAVEATVAEASAASEPPPAAPDTNAESSSPSDGSSSPAEQSQ